MGAIDDLVCKRINLKLSSRDYLRLLELNRVLESRSVSETLRILINLHWLNEQRAIRALAKARDERQMQLPNNAKRKTRRKR